MSLAKNAGLDLSSWLVQTSRNQCQAAEDYSENFDETGVVTSIWVRQICQTVLSSLGILVHSHIPILPILCPGTNWSEQRTHNIGNVDAIGIILTVICLNLRIFRVRQKGLVSQTASVSVPLSLSLGGIQCFDNRTKSGAMRRQSRARRRQQNVG